MAKTRDYDPFDLDLEGLEITEHTLPTLSPLIVGRTISSIHQLPYSGDPYGDGESPVIIVLDDGAMLTFRPGGDPGSWLTTEYVPAPGTPPIELEQLSR
jgi:hypothetical protein